MQDSTTYRVGDATITKIFEIGLDAVEGEFLFPGIDPASIARERGRFGPGSVDPRTGALRLSIHSWLVRTPERVVLIDTATGNDKERPGAAVLHRLNEPFLDRLRAAGVAPDDVDLVLMTHLHADNVGWNTSLAGDRWVPVFPNALHVFSGRELAYLAALSAGDGSDAAIRDAASLGPMLHPPKTACGRSSRPASRGRSWWTARRLPTASASCRAPVTASITPASASPRAVSAPCSGAM